MEKRNRILGLFVALVFLFSSIQIFVLPSKANPLTEVEVDLQDEPAKVDVSPGSSGIVKMEGTVYCKKWGPDQVKVYLNATSTFGGASVIPPSLVFGGSGGSEETKSIAVTTRVPQGTSCSETGTVTLSGYYVQSGFQYEIEPDSGTIIVLQYYLIATGYEKSNINKTAKPGEDTEIKFEMKNAGNGNDIFVIDFANREFLEEEGFKLPDPKEYVMPENGKENVSLKIGISEDKSINYNLEIFIQSKGSEESGFTATSTIPARVNIVESSITEKIGSVVLSPLFIGAMVIIIVIIVVLIRRKKG